MTNSQKFTYSLYAKHKDTILLYLKSCEAMRVFLETQHKRKYDFYTYTQKRKLRDSLKSLEAKLADYRISIRKLRDIYNAISKNKNTKNPLIEAFKKAFYADTREVQLPKAQVTRADMEVVNRIKSKRRTYALKGIKDIRVQTRILIRRLTNLYNVLQPQMDRLKFVTQIMQDMEANGSLLGNLISKAKRINPNFKW